MTVNVIHPTDFSDDVVITITDVSNDDQFADKWIEEFDDVQAEFGYDIPFFGGIDHTVTISKMTYKEYVALVQRSADSH